MNKKEIIEEIDKLPLSQRLYVIEQVMHTIRKQAENRQLETAAEEMLADYKSDKNLTAFSDLDFDEFYEAR